VRENAAWLICVIDTSRPSFSPFSIAETAETDASSALQQYSINAKYNNLNVSLVAHASDDSNYSAILHNDLWGALYAIAMALKVWWSKHKHTRTEMCLIPQVQNMNYKL